MFLAVFAESFPDTMSERSRKWAGAAKENGELLALATPAFDAFITTDQKLSYQQNVANFDIGVIVLVARRTKLEFLRPLMRDVQVVLTEIRSGEVCRIGVHSGI